MAKKKQKAKKQTAKKQKAKKQPAKKQPAKKQPPKKHKLTASTPGICTDFTASNNSQVCFQNVPPGGCTLTQLSGIPPNPNPPFPFSPYSTNPTTGLRYITLYPAPGNCTTIVVAAINQPYSYIVSCCLTGQATHSVTVT
ncbi:MAG: hypothetical protein WCA49_13380 [Candidatus Sulfotelmatobacter sp.]